MASYETITLDLDTDFAANGTNKIQLVPAGRLIRGVRCGLIVPSTGSFRVHLGQNADPIDFFQGDAFVDDGDGNPYNNGLFYSQTTAPTSGARANLTIFYP